MYKNQRRIKELTPYIPAVDIFRIYEREPGAAFLDSSLVNELGHYSVIGRCPYLKLVKDGENFTINGRPETETTFEDYMREYLNTHEDKNNSGLPIVSGAVGYFSYDYGRKQMGVPPLDVFYDLRKNNPSPFGGYLDFGDYQIVCASPERFLKMKDRHVNTRPIQGTRKRGVTSEEDEMLRRELQDSGKDRSELLMIVDLERNDLNRVCTPGSVKVTELFTVEAYATVFHLVSDIEGKLEEGKNVMDLLEAAFPGGSITGAPKYRAMEIIDELEHGKRNLYTGSIGYLTLDGSCDFNIVIRTALHKDGKYHLGVGGGITAESDLDFEYEETLQKAKAILDALQ